VKRSILRAKRSFCSWRRSSSWRRWASLSKKRKRKSHSHQYSPNGYQVETLRFKKRLMLRKKLHSCNKRYRKGETVWTGFSKKLTVEDKQIDRTQ
jgi:hypothetical protein